MRTFVIIFMALVVGGLAAGTIYAWFNPGEMKRSALIIMSLFSGIIVCQCGKALWWAIKHK